MPQRKRIAITTALFMLFALAANAVVADQATIEKQKREMVRGALEGVTHPVQAVNLENATERTSALLGIQIDSARPDPTITFELQGTPMADAFISEDARHLIVDLYGTIVVPNPRKMVIDGNNIIDGVKIFLYAIEPQFVTRTEIALTQPVSLRLNQADGVVTVRLTPLRPAKGPAQQTAREIHRLERRVSRQRLALDIALGNIEETLLRAGPSLTEAVQRTETALAEASRLQRYEKVALIQEQLAGIASSPHKTPVAYANPREQRGISASRQARLDRIGKALHTTLENQQASRARIQDAIRTATTTIRTRTASQRLSLSALATTIDTAGLRSATLHTLAGLAADVHKAGPIDAELFESLLWQTQQNLFDTHANLQGIRDALAQNGRPIHAGAVQTRTPLPITLENAPEESLRTRLAQLDSKLLALRAGARSQKTPSEDPLDNRLEALSEALESVKANQFQASVETTTYVGALIPSANDTYDNSLPPSRRVRPSPNSLAAAQQRQAYPKLKMLSSAPFENHDIIDRDIIGHDIIDHDIIVLAQAIAPGVSDAEDVEEDIEEDQSDQEEPALRRLTTGLQRGAPSFNLYNPDRAPEDDPLRQLVNVDVRQMDVTAIVSLLAQKGQINVVAGTEVSGLVNAHLTNIELGRAIEIILRMNSLGIIEEDGIWRITTYGEAVASRRDTRMIPLRNAAASELKATLDEVISGSAGAGLLSIAANETANVLILSGPLNLVRDYEVLINQLDTAEPVIPTETVAIPLDYSLPQELEGIVLPLLSDVGKVSSDTRSRHLILTDLPNVVAEISKIVEALDQPVKQVSIETMIVDAIITDDAKTGIDWIFDVIRRHNRDGDLVGNLAGLGGQSDFTTGSLTQGIVPGIDLGGQLAFAILSGDIDIRGIIGAEVRSQNATILASPLIVTIENETASISIAEEIPYQELTQSSTGPPISTTEFKEVGTVLKVTPRVTHDNHIIIEIDAKQSDTKGESITGVPIEDKRGIKTTLLLRDGQTVFIGGLRRFDDELSVRKVPFLGDIPGLNLLFRTQTVVKQNLELMIFLTCNVLADDIPDLSPSQKTRYDELGGTSRRVDGTRALLRHYVHPEDTRDPFYKWRRQK